MSVVGNAVTVKIREDLLSTLIIIDGNSYRIGQIGSFLRIPLGYTNLYAICTQIGVNPPLKQSSSASGEKSQEKEEKLLPSHRWMTIALFGESTGKKFERGVAQHPTTGDEVHIVTDDDIKIIYDVSKDSDATVSVGSIASTAGISADINIAKLVSRHCAVVGSTGSGKSNLVTVLLEILSSEQFPNSRVIVIDPHGEYTTALGDKASVFSTNPYKNGEKKLIVPFWALPFDELSHIIFPGLQENHEASIRDAVLDMKKKSSSNLPIPPLLETLTADSPIPFNIKKLWYELDWFEKSTFNEPGAGAQTEDTAAIINEGNFMKLESASFIPAGRGNSLPYLNKGKRGIDKKLEFMASRLRDERFSFLFDPGDGFSPDCKGHINKDVDLLARDWIGQDKPVSIFDVSDVPSEILFTVVGTMLKIIYDMLFWGQNLPIGGKQQPLLIVLEEAHRFFPIDSSIQESSNNPAYRILSKIAKEGRKYGIGLTLVSQRPSDISSAILSQVGSFIALRLTNSLDRSTVASCVPDDLGDIIKLLPSLRTGEGIFLGEIMPIPSRVRVRKAQRELKGNDPDLPHAWQKERNTNCHLYQKALTNWRAQSLKNTIDEED